jgi:Dolichyl-phosphate-mannose-protein mannosyltransferase
MKATYALGILVCVTAAIRLWCSAWLGLGNDEAYHYLYATHPALSYFDHPPMMAWVEMAGLALPGAGNAAWALRIGFIGLFAGSTLLLARLTARYCGEKAGFFAALALNLTGYYGLAAAMFALPDGPLLFFWLLTLDRLSLAVSVGWVQPTAVEAPRSVGFTDSTRNLRHWIEAGLAWGGAMLSKYHAIFIPLGVAVLLLLDPRRRRQLRRPGPYLALALGLIVFSPVLIWNVQHGWVSFLFQGGRAVGGWIPRPDYLAKAILAQAGYLFPWIWIPLVMLFFRGWRRWPAMADGPEPLWLCVAAVPLVVFTAVACFRQVLPHWGLIGLVPLFPMLGRAWAERMEARPEFVRRGLATYAGLSLILIGLTLVEFRTGWFQRGGSTRWGLLTDRTDPTLDFYGWDQVAARIRQLGLVDDPHSFVFTRYWYQSAQLAYALGGDRPAVCYNSDDPRGFAFWSRPEDWIGHDGVLVLVGDEPKVIARYFNRWFTGVEPVSEFWVERGGKPVRRIQLYRCRQQRIAYPFAIDRAHRLAQQGTSAGQAERTTR